MGRDQFPPLASPASAAPSVEHPLWHPPARLLDGANHRDAARSKSGPWARKYDIRVNRPRGNGRNPSGPGRGMLGQVKALGPICEALT